MLPKNCAVPVAPATANVSVPSYLGGLAAGIASDSLAPAFLASIWLASVEVTSRRRTSVPFMTASSAEACGMRLTAARPEMMAPSLLSAVPSPSRSQAAVIVFLGRTKLEVAYLDTLVPSTVVTSPLPSPSPHPTMPTDIANKLMMSFDFMVCPLKLGQVGSSWGESSRRPFIPGLERHDKSRASQTL